MKIMLRHFRAHRASAIKQPSIMESIEDRTLFSTFIVTTTSDSGAGSFRDAIYKSNKSSDTDTIQFSIGSGLKTITPSSQLPFINYPVVIDATTQGGYAGKPLIELKGSNVGGYGLQLGGGNSTVKGLIINRFGGDGILIVNKGGNTIKGNWIGVDNTGNVDAGNRRKGIVVNAAGNTIGGTGANDRNVISGNDQGGIQLYTYKAASNKILGNYIGTNASGTAAVGNGTSGVAINGAPNNVIGGTSAGARNVISGNKQDGVVINQSGGTGNIIQGNYIGVNAAGNARLSNEWYGVETSQKNTLIGGSAAGAGNVISGNKYSGVVLWLDTGSYNTVQGNYIGTDATGLNDIGNYWRGVDVSNGSSYNTIGGATSAERNIISGNDLYGVLVYQGTNNLFQNNYVGFGKDGATAVGNLGDGFRLVTAKNTTVKGNLIGNNSGYAIHNGASTGTIATGNTLVNDVLFLVKAT
jgi:hypothetical protein